MAVQVRKSENQVMEQKITRSTPGKNHQHNVSINGYKIGHYKVDDVPVALAGLLVALQPTTSEVFLMCPRRGEREQKEYIKKEFLMWTVSFLSDGPA